jgi:hypothetical protein
VISAKEKHGKLVVDLLDELVNEEEGAKSAKRFSDFGIMIRRA